MGLRRWEARCICKGIRLTGFCDLVEVVFAIFFTDDFFYCNVSMKSLWSALSLILLSQY